jgi:hypothetical protein
LGISRLDQGAKAKAETGSGSLILGAAGAYAEAEASATVFTCIAAGAMLSAGTDVKLLSLVNNDASSETSGYGFGAIGVGVSLSYATAGSHRAAGSLTAPIASTIGAGGAVADRNIEEGERLQRRLRRLPRVRRHPERPRNVAGHGRSDVASTISGTVRARGEITVGAATVMVPRSRRRRRRGRRGSSTGRATVNPTVAPVINDATIRRRA